MLHNGRPNRRRVLVLGATGTTGSRVARRLEAEGHDVRGVSRSTAPRFAWEEPVTFDPCLDGMDAVYLLPPVAVVDAEPLMVPFVERALDHGVRRFVLLSASVIPEGAPGVGRVHAVLRERAPGWAVLRPSWFMQNFERGHYMAEDVRAGRLVTSVADGRVAFVDADDIAAVAVRALVDDPAHQTDHVITGPAPLSYDDVAAVLGTVARRPVVHERVGRDAVRDRLVAAGIPQAFAGVLADLEAPLRDGAEDRVSDAVERVTGRAPRSFAAWAQAHAHAWRQGDDVRVGADGTIPITRSTTA